MAKRYRNTYSSAEYNTSSNAYAYDHEIYEEDDRRLAERLKAEREAEALRKKSFVHRAKFVVSIFFVFGCCIVTMASNAAVDKQRVTNNSLKDELSQIKNENIILQSKITENTDLSYIEEQAKTRLGMTEPQPYQIYYIDVPKQSYTEQYEAEGEEKKEEFGVTKFFGVVKDMVKPE